MKKIYLVVMVLAAMLTGCAANSSLVVTANVDNAHKLAKDDSGIVYGPFASADGVGVTVQNACNDIKGNDARCANQDDYVIGAVVPEVGAVAGAAPVLVLVPKSTGINACRSMDDDDCTFLKVRAEAGKFASIVEVASRPGEKKCYWTGGGKLGSGTVCPAYGWNYKTALRNFDAASATSGNGVLSVK